MLCVEKPFHEEVRLVSIYVVIIYANRVLSAKLVKRLKFQITVHMDVDMTLSLLLIFTFSADAVSQCGTAA